MVCAHVVETFDGEDFVSCEVGSECFLGCGDSHPRSFKDVAVERSEALSNGEGWGFLASTWDTYGICTCNADIPTVGRLAE